jgi:uncharacterized protein (TIGR03435 family)
METVSVVASALVDVILSLDAENLRSACIVVSMKSGNERKRIFGAVAIVLLGLVAAEPHRTRAQDVNAKAAVGFEVATVKPDDPHGMTMIEIRVYPGGRLVVSGYTLRNLIEVAFDRPGWQVVGGEKWLDELRFDVEGKPPDDVRKTIGGGEFSNVAMIQNEQVRLMLQALLVERFHLKFHMENQPGTVDVLKRGNGPLRLEPVELNLYTKAEDGSVSPSHAYPTGDMGMAGGAPVGIHQTSMGQLARELSELQGVPVSDETGLEGFYNFKSQTIVTNEDFKNGGPMHLLVDAVPEMGLKLVKTQGLVEKFVVDHAESPTAN